MVSLKDELVIRSVIQALKLLIKLIAETTLQSKLELATLVKLCNVNDDGEDCLGGLLNIKIRQRQKSLKYLKTAIDEGMFKNCMTGFERVILPLVDFIIFGGKNQS